MEPPLRILVIVYPEHDTAVKAYDLVRQLDHEGKVKVQDAAVVVAHADGQLEVVSTHRHAVKSAGKAAFWGLLIGGALALPVVGLVLAGGAVGLGAHKSDRGKESAFAERVAALLKPGKTALFVTGTTGTATPGRADRAPGPARRRARPELAPLGDRGQAAARAPGRGAAGGRGGPADGAAAAEGCRHRRRAPGA